MTEEIIEEVIEEPQLIKLGEKEYSQDDLSRLVGLGEIADELETKWDTKIDRIMPKYTKTTQELAELRKQIAEKPAPQPFEGLTPEQKDLARKQLADLGYGEDQFRNIVREELAAKELLSSVDVIIDDAHDNGQPTTTPAELLQHMADTGIKNPVKAYKDMFETELDAIKERKLAEIKPSGMVTTTTSTAGSKQPKAPERPKNREELFKQVQEAIGGQS